MNIDQATKVVQRRTRQLPYAPDLGIEHEPWMDSALCAQMDPDMFFPEGRGASNREAKRICAACDVRNECLLFALANHEHFGVWGGMSERERRRLSPSGQRRNYRHHDVAPCGTDAAYRRHYRHREPVDDACNAAHVAANRERARRRSRGIRGAA